MEDQSTTQRINYVQLRTELAPEISALKDAATHEVLPELCAKLGMPAPANEGSKRDRIESSFSALSDTDLPLVARNFLRLYPPNALTRNKIQDILWAAEPCPVVPKRFRRELAKTLDHELLFVDTQRFDKLLDSLWVLDTGSFADILRGHHGLRDEIAQHVYRHPEDWTVEYLFDRLGVYESSDGRFALFLEGLASSDVRPDEYSQRCFVERVNAILKNCGVELHETGADGGYPIFKLISPHVGVRRSPKNLIFASSTKPDLRFRDALDNEIEIVSNAEQVLVYDRQIGHDGLRWGDLQRWWSETNSIDDAESAKKTLYRRLRGCLPINSPPQLLLFDAFYEGFGGAVPNLPALLPEVWLHWDPKTAKARGRDALLRFRMDFLLLLPQNIRVVIEVDGKHHYADSANGMADVRRYAQMARADRELKLAGYEVYRFGAAELQGADDKATVKNFFDGLFARFDVTSN